MASYKDSPNLKFSPYVQTLPIEAMAKVGMYKQQRYDQGVQKIQQSIDNIAGLDIVRPEDKQYLQSKLNQLGSQLSSVAGGDFSNFALVNSVNGMTNQIVKDPKIMNAVSNTARYKKDLASVEKLNEEGKWGPSNQLAFQKDVNKWFEGGQDSSYSANVTPYRDINKSSRDIIKSLGKKETGYDVAFDENGQLVDAITRVKVTGISSERIRAALKQGLSPADYRQLEIDGQYKYSNTSSSQYINDINLSYQNTFEKYSQERDKLVALKNAASSSTEQQRLQEQIEQIDGTIKSVKSEYDIVSNGFENGNVTGSQAQLYTMNWLEDTSNAYATESVIKSYQNNPLAQMQLKRDQMRQTAQIASDKLTETRRYNNERLRIEKEKNQLVEGNPYGRVPLPTSTDATTVDVIAAMEANRDTTKNSADALKNNYQNKYKLSNEAFQQELIAYVTNPNSVSWDRRETLNQYINQQKNLTVQDDIITRANAEANILFEGRFLEELPENVRNQKINGYNYGQAAILFDRFDNEYKSDIQYKGERVDRSRFKESQAELDYNNNKLSDKEYGLYQIWAASKGSEVYKNEIGDDLKNLVNVIEDISTRKLSGIEDDRQKYIKDYYQQNYLINQEQAYRIPLGNAEQKDEFRPVLNSLAELIDRSGGLPNFKGSSEDIRSIASDLQTAMVFTDSKENYKINVSNSKGTSMSIPINREIYDSVFQGRFESSPAVSSFNKMYLLKMLSTPTPLYETEDERGNVFYKKTPTSYYSTSLDGEYNTTQDNSYLSGPTDFANVQYYRVSGNIVSDAKPTDSDSFKIQLNVYDPVTRKTVLENFLLPARIDKASLVPTLQQLTDEVIWQLINNTEKDIPTSEIKNLQEASQIMQ